MRNKLLKFTRHKSTKAERRFLELLKKNRIPFRAKVKIQGREVDFIVGRCAIDIDGHKQESGKNEMLVREGFIPIHFHNREVEEKIINKILQC